MRAVMGSYDAGCAKRRRRRRGSSDKLQGTVMLGLCTACSEDGGNVGKAVTTGRAHGWALRSMRPDGA
ncbi:hypothetical protein M0R45_009276 [Rubus argutus]|uniref:Uncharacterized protein n=1 Tax=Rubus argutus TaxID=59490 RepID=A0AAW1Y5D6_RUBAR